MRCMNCVLFVLSHLVWQNSVPQMVWKCDKISTPITTFLAALPQQKSKITARCPLIGSVRYFNSRALMEEYTYKALDNDPVNPQIRLLRLLPGSHDAPIQCTIGRVGLNEPPHFEALSYTWGTDQSLDPVICDGKTISVTSNLLAALHQFRSRSRALTLWIDAICINQADNTEKNKQVVLMRCIYILARRVLIWLNPSSGDSWEAMMLIPKLLWAKDI